MTPHRRSFVFACLFAAITVGQDKKQGADVRSYLHSCERFGFSGSVLVAKGGKVVLADGFGLADRDKNVRNTKETLFEIASATKSFTGVAILQLEADGKLSCDDPIAKHLPGVPEGFDDVTIRHLLTHTSGMPRSAVGGSGDDLQQAVAGYLAASRKRKAGTAYEYWNGGYALLAGIIERASGGTYMDWCRKRIFEPAGMKSSGFTGDSLDPARISIGYEGDAAPRRANEHPYNSYGWHYRGMGGLVTSVDDVFKFDRALQSDTLLPAKARAKLFTPFLENYASGFYVLDQPRRIGHGGDVRGFHCRFFSYPANDACIIVLANCGGIPTWAIEENLRSLLLGDPSRYPKPPPTVEWPKTKLDALTGIYEAAPGERIVVRASESGVKLGAEGREIAQRLTTSVFGPPRAAEAALVQAAEAIVRKVSEGDVELLRERINKGIQADWPDRVKSIYWPERVASLGKLKNLRISGASNRDSSTTVLFAIDFEKGVVHLKTMFIGDRLQIFDLHGPEFLAEAVAQPASDSRLVRFAWEGPQPAPIAIIRDTSGRPSGLRFESSPPSAVYKRLEPK